MFVDGRYTVQGRIQSGKKFNIITIPLKFPKDVLKPTKKIIIGFDPKLHSEKQLNLFFNIKNIILKPMSKNLIDVVENLIIQLVSGLLLCQKRLPIFLSNHKLKWVIKQIAIANSSYHNSLLAKYAL